MPSVRVETSITRLPAPSSPPSKVTRICPRVMSANGRATAACRCQLSGASSAEVMMESLPVQRSDRYQVYCPAAPRLPAGYLAIAAVWSLRSEVES